MAYESLYRRYRPQRFSDVRGQDHVVAALHNAVRENRVGHAYLLSGPRGTGKTSTARILAKALNCTDLADGEPCGTCDSCQAIESGTSYDLMELDAASNNGVDAMRDLIAKAALGSPGRTKVYLLDEVHMLSAGASNALLKTLEEPPGHVVFVLATTDPHKVLPTIRSRTQHFELHLLSANELRALVDHVVADAGLDVDDKAVDYVLRVGGGSARDTLSALDQVVAAGGVLDDGDDVDGLVDALCANDTGAALRAVADATAKGRDPRVLGEALLARLRDIFLLRMGDPLAHIPDDQKNRIRDWSENLTDRACTRGLEAIGDALREMRNAPDTRIPLEIALVKLTRADADASIEQLVARIERLERGITAGPTAAASVHAATDSSPTAADNGEPSPARKARPADAARAVLGNKAKSTPPPTRPAAPAQTPARNPVAPHRPTNRDSEPVVDPAPSTPDDLPVSDKAPPPVQATSASGNLPDLETLWTTQVLPSLSGLTKAMFSVGHFVRVECTNGTFAVPNDVHRSKSLQKLGEVETALTNAMGAPCTISLVVEGESGNQPAAPQTPASPEAQIAAERDEVGPISELADAPTDARSTTQRIVDAFPGAEIVEN